MTTKAIRNAAAPASAATIPALPQPSSLPRSSARTSRKRPPISVTCPGTSIRRGVGSRPSGTERKVIQRTAAPIGTLTRKIARQPNSSVSPPPMNGPSANEAPIAAPKAASALARSSRLGVTWEISASAVANISEAPSPWIARAPTRTSMLGAAPHSAELAVKITRP